MAESKAPIASGVILPDEIPTSPRAKRRQSSASDATAKRPRLSISGDARSPTADKTSPRAGQDASADRRRSSVAEERKRGQRLFGGLLSTLSQSTSNGQQKRRFEIEKRQQEKAKQQKVEDEGRKVERLARLREIRKVEQVKFDEQSMRIRHSNMLAMAHFLCTKTEPKVYYKPWELLPRDEERIKSQIAEAEALINQEEKEFKARHSTLTDSPISKDNEKQKKANNTSDEMVGELLAEPPSATTKELDTTNKQAPESGETAKVSLELHNGEVVVENEEDTVIY